MFRKLSGAQSSLLFVVVLAAIAISAPSATAGVVVVNGDFELPGTHFGTSSFPQGIPNWGEANVFNNNFSDFLIVGAPHGAYLNGQTAGISQHVVGNGFIYQEIGTSDGASTVNISGLNFWRNDGPAMQHGPLLVEMFWLPAAHGFAFAEWGNDIKGIGTLISSVIVADPPALNTTTPFSIDFDVSGIAANARLFVRFDAASTSNFAYVDNVTASTAPEPASLVLVALALAMAGLGRRRKTANHT